MNLCRLINVYVFDPQLVYTFMESITEYDNFVIYEKEGLLSRVVIEDVSGLGEWRKAYLYQLLRPSHGLAILWGESQGNVKRLSEVIPITPYPQPLCTTEDGDSCIKLNNLAFCLTGHHGTESGLRREVDCIREIYWKASEPYNLMLLALTLMSYKALRKIMDDVHISLHSKRNERSNGIIATLRDLANTFCNNEIPVISGCRASIEELKNIDVLAALPQLGMHSYRAESAIHLLLAIQCCIFSQYNKNVEVHVFLSKAFVDQSKEAVGMFLKPKVKPVNINGCNVDSINWEVHNRYKSDSELINDLRNLIRKHKTLIVIIGDYSKYILTEVLTSLNRDKRNKPYILVVPEVIYAPKTNGEMKIQSIGGYLTKAATTNSKISCEKFVKLLQYKALLLRWCI